MSMLSGRHRLRQQPVALLLLAALLPACGRELPPGEATPLVDGVHAPLVLTERALLAMPPDVSANRFVSGWWPGRRDAPARQINTGERAVLEAVFLDGRERRLNTRMDVLEAAEGAAIGVRVAGIELPPVPLVRDLEVPLPADLPLGRLPIELHLGDSKVAVFAAGFGHAWPAGEVEATPESIVQGGFSAIDFPRRLTAPAVLAGRFEPPAEPEEDQRFALLVDSDAGDSEVGFEWRAAERRGGGAFEVELPAGFVRVRLLAQGLGPAGRWRGLALFGGGAAAAAEAIELSTAEGRDGPVYVAASRRYRLIRSPGLGLADEEVPTRDAEYVFDRRRPPAERRNLAGTRAIEVDWLRSRLEAWLERGAGS